MGVIEGGIEFIVEDNGMGIKSDNKISFESEYKVGTRFIIELPLAK